VDPDGPPTFCWDRCWASTSAFSFSITLAISTKAGNSLIESGATMSLRSPLNPFSKFLHCQSSTILKVWNLPRCLNFSAYSDTDSNFTLFSSILPLQAICWNFHSTQSSSLFDRLNRWSVYLPKWLQCLSQFGDRSVDKCNYSNKCEIKILTNLPLGPIYSFRCGPIIRAP